MGLRLVALCQRKRRDPARRFIWPDQFRRLPGWSQAQACYDERPAPYERFASRWLAFEEAACAAR